MAKVTWSTNQTSAPRWAAQSLGDDELIPGGALITVADIAAPDAVSVKAGAVAAIDATTVAVTALTGEIPNGTILKFGAKKFAKLTAKAAKAAESITFEALAVALAQNDVATYAGASLTKPVASGTLLGRTLAERDSGSDFGPWTTGDEEVYLLAFDISDVNKDNSCTLVAHNVIIYEDLLPGWASWVAGQKTALRAAYQCIVSSNAYA